ncbi:sensor histidine kinase [Flavitalea antarctica]
MLSRDFIFSERKSDRIKRHLLFWLCFWIFNAFLPGYSPGRNYFSNLPNVALKTFQDIIPQMFFAYALIGFILPAFVLKNKYFFSFFWIIFFVFATGALGFILANYVFPGTSVYQVPGNLWVNLVSYSKGTLVAATAVCSIRLFKHWHLQEKRNLELLKEKTEAQLQLLTAQVHPHFLFNTLNNIYSRAQDESPEGAKMIMELSQILRYVLDEGKHELVPLDKELQMLTDYLHLEKLRYDKELDLHILLPSKTSDLYITPLLLLPFVENCFEHGISDTQNKPWINLKIELQDTALVMKLMNGKKTTKDANTDRDGIGMQTVKKRLELLYPGKHDLQINEDEDVFIVNLRLELARITSAIPVQLSANSKVSMPGVVIT